MAGVRVPLGALRNVKGMNCRQKKKVNSKLFNKIKTYLENEFQTEISFSAKETLYEPNKNIIYLNYSEKQIDNICLISELLHELGHVEIIKKNNFSFLINHFANINTNYSKCNSKKKFIDHIREEILAWEIGWKIGEELGIKISWHDFHSIMQSDLWTYFERIDIIPAFAWRLKNKYGKYKKE